MSTRNDVAPIALDSPRERSAATSRLARVFLASAISLVVAVHLPALHAPFFMDDFTQKAIVEGTYPSKTLGPWDLYDFIDDSNRAELVERGILPWWSHPKMVVHFLRPLPSLLVWVDHALFGTSAFWDHVHSFLWWACATLAVRLLLRMAFSERVAWAGAAVFALSPCHVISLVWLANRAALVSITFGTLALLVYARWRETRRARDGLASFALFALAMLAGEYTLSFGGYVLAIEAVRRRESIPRRMIGIASFALPALAYLATFAALHCGAHGTGFYRDPVSDFRVFASEVPRSVAILLGAAWAGLDIDAWMWAPGWQLAVVATGIALALAVPIRRTLRELDDTTRVRATWMLLGSALSLVPLLAAEPSGRLLGVPTVGVSAIVALVVDHAWFPKTPQPRRGAAELTGLVALGLAFAHFVRGPLETWTATSTLTRSTIAYDERIAWVREHAADKSMVVIVRANVPPSILFTPLMLGNGARLRTLSYASGRFLLLRTGERSLELVAGTHPLFPMGPGDMFRDFEFPLHVGEEVKLEELRATVVQLRDDGTPRRLRYDFDRDLDDSSVLWIVEGDSGFREEKPPAPGYGEPIMR